MSRLSQMEEYVDLLNKKCTGNTLNPAVRNQLVDSLRSGQYTAAMVELAVRNSREGKAYAAQQAAALALQQQQQAALATQQQQQAALRKQQLREYIAELRRVYLGPSTAGNGSDNDSIQAEQYAESVESGERSLQEVEDMIKVLLPFLRTLF